jgi:molybdate/tungstate transport system substrate-binding protein
MLAAFAAAALVVGGSVGCKARSEIVVFHAASLSRLLVDVSERFERKHPTYVIRSEPSGSQVAARKVAELGLPADVVLAADIRVLDEILLPDHADWTLGFATNEIVLAHAQHSRYTEVVTAQSWPEVLTRATVRLGCVRADLAPIGYQTLLAWKLAGARVGGSQGADLPARLTARCAPEHVVSDEAELAALLEARAVDYAFLYRSTAEDHRLKLTALPAEVNLGHPEIASIYAGAEVEVEMRHGAARSRIRGTPLLYGLAIPRGASNAEGALLFAAFLLGEDGRAALSRAGFRAVVPAACAAGERLPPALRRFSGSAP